MPVGNDSRPAQPFSMRVRNSRGLKHVRLSWLADSTAYSSIALPDPHLPLPISSSPLTMITAMLLVP